MRPPPDPAVREAAEKIALELLGTARRMAVATGYRWPRIADEIESDALLTLLTDRHFCYEGTGDRLLGRARSCVRQ
jgi:hypothetical protein